MAYIVAVQLQHIYALLLRRATSVSQIVNALNQYTPPPGSTLKAVANLPLVSTHFLFLEIDLVCDNNDATSHSWYELIQSLSILKALILHKLEGF